MTEGARKSYSDQTDWHMVDAAKNRAVVRLRDGRTARLVYWPASTVDVSRVTGARARVELRTGVYVSIDVGDVTLTAGGEP
jgi:hypothetical protein